MGGPGRDASENEGKGTRGFRVELRNHPIGVGSALGNQGSLDLPSYLSKIATGRPTPAPVCVTEFQVTRGLLYEALNPCNLA